MPIKSYIVYPTEGDRNNLIEYFQKNKNIEVFPSVNHKVIVILTDTKSIIEEKELEEYINICKYIKVLTLSTGFEE